ncbi:MAG: multiubiquitin domain-containing protein [Verrucomicrobiota bacterium]
MNTNQMLEREDVGGALREGRPLRLARAYGVLYAQDNLKFRALDLLEPAPLGRQILEAAGAKPIEDFSLFAILPNGDFEEVLLDQPFDLRKRGAERFVGFDTDRLYKFTLDGRQYEWGKPAIKGTELYKLGEVPKGRAVFLKLHDGEPRLITREELVDLSAPGVEHFVTGPKPVTDYEIIVNARPRIVHDEDVTFEQVVELAFPGPHGPNITFSMTYRHAASKPHAGELGAGGVVEVKHKGTIFNVTKTDKS